MDGKNTAVLMQITARLAASGGLLHGRYSSNANAQPCYCIIGAIREEIMHLRPMGAPIVDDVNRFAAELLVTLPDYDPDGYAQVKASIDALENRHGGKAAPQEWIFLYNDDVLAPQPADNAEWPAPSIEGRERAVGLLTATLARLKAA